MIGLIGKLTATPGKREELMAILAENATGMPGCLSYVIAADATLGDVIWVTEAWESESAHKASLDLPGVQSAIGRARPMIAGMERIATTTPVAGL